MSELQLRVVGGSHAAVATGDASRRQEEAAWLREMAARIETGEVKAFVAVFETSEVYERRQWANAHDAVVMSALLHRRAMDSFCEG